MPSTGRRGISRLGAMDRWRPAEGSHNLFLLVYTMGTNCTQWDDRQGMGGLPVPQVMSAAAHPVESQDLARMVPAPIGNPERGKR